MAYVAEPVKELGIKEIGYAFKRTGAYGGLKATADPAAAAAANGLRGTGIEVYLSNIGKALGFGTAESAAGVIAIGLTAAISAGLTIMDYNHKRGNLKELYKEELVSLTGKKPEKVTVSDLDTLAKNNAVLGEEIGRSKRQRNVGVFISFAASMVALSAIAAIPAVAVAMGLAATTAVVPMAAFTSMVGIGMFALHGAVAIVAYNLVKNPLHKLADKLFHLDEKTTNDRIIDIERDREAGKIISREQVLAAFASANPELDQLIVSTYGKHFDDLDVATKKRATADLNRLIPLDKITLDINAGKLNVTELAFAVEGKSSGVHHDGSERHEEHRHRLGNFLKCMQTKIDHTKVGHNVERVAESAMGAGDDVTQVVQQEPITMRPFAEKLGLAKKGSHVERLEQSRAEQASYAGIPQP